MSHARLTRIGLRNFKSFGPEMQEVSLAPLTILVGRNNSGKSSIIQSLLLLKQTLIQRGNERLYLQGPVDALNLRELTHGWPGYENPRVVGPWVELTWESFVDVDTAVRAARRMGSRERLASDHGIDWLEQPHKRVRLRTTMQIIYVEDSSFINIVSLRLRSFRADDSSKSYPELQVVSTERDVTVAWNNTHVPRVSVDFDHFIPHLTAARYSDATRSVVGGFRVLYEQPLEDLKEVLVRLGFVGSMRTVPPSIYRPTSSPPDDVGISGEYAAQVLHARRAENVHFLSLLTDAGESGPLTLPDTVRALPLVEAVNEIFRQLDVKASFRLEDVQDVGFRLLFGRASLQHVGRGISYLLPVIIAGLYADPLHDGPPGDMPLDRYLEACTQISHLAMEEPESHLHPKVQTLLAHFMVSLAMAGRQLIIETHSDHLVRRLRALVARAAPGSPAERWLLENVAIVHVEQDEEGRTHLEQSRLTREGAIGEHWPADFMDEASNEEQSIYYAAMDKREAAKGAAPYAAGTEFVEGKDDEDE